MDPIERASIILGKKSSGYVDKNTSATNSTNVTMITGDAMSDSSDGVVSVNLYGYTISDDDEQYVDIPTTVNVQKGDTVQISMVGADGTAKSMLVTGVIAGGDRMQEQIDSLVANVEEQYGISDDPATEPTEWSTTAPTATEGQYIWTRSVVTNGKGEQFVSDTICISQSAGGIAGIDVQYYMSDSASELTGGSWMTSSPTWEDGKYIWSKTVTTNSDGTTSESTPICIAGTGIPMTEIDAAIDTKIDDIDNGGNNLLRNSNTLIFSDYNFSASTVTTGDTPIETVKGKIITSTTVGEPGNAQAAHGIGLTDTIKDFFVDDGTDIKRAEIDTVKKALENLAGTVVSDAIKAYVDEQIKAKRLESRPVGYVWVSFDSTNPGTIVGGTWELVEQGRMLLSAGSDYSVGSTGGEAEHTLTIDEMPTHRHEYQLDSMGNGAIKDGGVWFVDAGSAGTNINPNLHRYTFDSGGSKPHNNMSPFIAVYMFRRTA